MSQIFHPFKTVGSVTGTIPVSFYRSSERYYMAAPIDKMFKYYELSHLNVLMVSPEQPHKIRCIIARKKFTFTGCRNLIIKWYRAKLAGILTGHNGKINAFLNFGNYLLSVGQDKKLIIWNPKYNSIYSEIELKKVAINMCHPPAYVNKILIIFDDGTFDLMNLKTQKKIYSFKGWGSEIVSVEASNALETVAFGLKDGRIMIHNLRYDKLIISFKQSEGEVTSLSFRTDGFPVLVSGTPQGDIILWHLEEKKILTVMKNVHSSRITTLKFLSQEPILFSTGADNKIKEWIFDRSDWTARLLRSKEGHRLPPTRVKKLLASMSVMTCGPDREFRKTNVSQENSIEYSQGSTELRSKKLKLSEFDIKLPPIIDFDRKRKKDWDDILTCHEEHRAAYTWSSSKKILGKYKFYSTDPNHNISAITAVCVSSCGNFGIIGNQYGWVDKYNLQSGLHRGSFSSKIRSHIQNLIVDMVNKYLIVAYLKGTIKFVDFKTLKNKGTLKLETGISRTVLNRSNNLLAVACDDFSILVVDVESQKIARKLSGHGNQISDLVFSPNGRWVVSASYDQTVRTWDIPTSQVIDIFMVYKIVTSLEFSPTGDFLFTTHANTLGINMWANKVYFGQVYLKPVSSLKKIPYGNSIFLTVNQFFTDRSNTRIKLLKVLYGSKAVEESGERDEEEYEEYVENEEYRENQNIKEIEQEGELEDLTQQLEEGLITLSTQSRARWQSLRTLDIVKERNKPVDLPKKQESVPFFIQTTFGAEKPLNNNDSNENGDNNSEPRSKILNLSTTSPLSNFFQKLKTDQESQNFEESFQHINSFSPTALHFEFSSMKPNVEHHLWLLEMFAHLIPTNQHFELLQSYLNLYLKIHSDFVVGDEQLLQKVEELKEMITERWVRLETLFQNNLALLSFCSKIQN